MEKVKNRGWHSGGGVVFYQSCREAAGTKEKNFWKTKNFSWQAGKRVIKWTSPQAKRRAPCKLNNVRETRSTKRTRQVVHEAWSFVGQRSFSLNSWKLDYSDQWKWFGQQFDCCLDTILLRVWSWLRMNAGGVLNTCKSNGEPLTEFSDNG